MSDSGLPLPFPRQFHCEHTQSKHRVLVLVSDNNGTAYLQAVLSCADGKLARRAARVLNAALGKSPESFVHHMCEDVAAELPHAPAASLRQTVQHLCAGTWPLNPHLPKENRPDFAQLFPEPACDIVHEDGEEADTCNVCGSWYLTPRTAEALHAELSLQSDMVYDDVEALGDDPVERDNGNYFLSEFPRVTWGQSRKWRRELARACDDLVNDLEAGMLPRPRCTAEEVVLYLAIQGAPTHVEEYLPEHPEDEHHILPQHPDDYAWEACMDLLYEDHDFLFLYERRFDGIEDPEDETNQLLHIGGSLRPESWFRPFYEDQKRDPKRGFRR